MFFKQKSNLFFQLIEKLVLFMLSMWKLFLCFVWCVFLNHIIPRGSIMFQWQFTTVKILSDRPQSFIGWFISSNPIHFFISSSVFPVTYSLSVVCFSPWLSIGCSLSFSHQCSSYFYFILSFSLPICVSFL